VRGDFCGLQRACSCTVLVQTFHVWLPSIRRCRGETKRGQAPFLTMRLRELQSVQAGGVHLWPLSKTRMPRVGRLAAFLL